MNEMPDESIHQMSVVEQHGRTIGVVAEVLVDTDAWTVSHLKITLNREVLDDLNLKKPLFGTQTIRIPSSELAGAQDVLVLKRKLEDLKFDGGVPAGQSWSRMLFSSKKDRRSPSDTQQQSDA